MHFRSKRRKLLGSSFEFLLLASFFITPLASLIPFVWGAPGDWWNTDWTFRKSVIINHANMGGTLGNFPVLIDITDPNLSASARSDGAEIVFVDNSSNVKLNHQIESFDKPTGHLVAWVNVPSVSSTTDTILYMYYGNPASGDQQNPTAVWDSNYMLVQHLNEKSGSTCYDSTAKKNDGTVNGNIVLGATGKIDGAYAFDGATSFVQVPHNSSLAGFASGFTVSFWLRLDDVSKRQSILQKYDTSGNQRGWMIEYRTDVGKALALLASSNGVSYDWWYASFNPTAGTWYYVTAVWESNTVPKFYVNGLQVSTVRTGTISQIFSNSGAPLQIGKSTYQSGREFKGTLDETRLSNVVRSSSQIIASYNNQRDPSTFYTMGSEENQSSGAITISNVNPKNGATDVYPNPQLSISAADTAGRNMTIVFNTNASGIWKEIARYSNVGNGVYNCTPADMKDLGTKYYWSVNATDGIVNADRLYSFTTTTILNPYWQYRRTISIDPSKVSGNQTNFPVLLDITDSSLGKVQPDGDDFLFIDTNQVKLDHEIEMFDGDTGHLVVWVRIPFLSSTAFTEFYMYYGNSSVSSQQNPAAVWDSSYRMVLHLYEKTGIHYDSTANGNNGTPNGGLAQGITGKIDGADSFDGVNDFVEVPHSGTISGFTTALTASFWVRFDDSNRRQTLLNKYNTAGNQRGWYIEYRNLEPLGKTLGFFASQNGINYKEWYTSFSPTLGVYYYITLVWEANALPRFYVNGQQSPTIYTGTISYIYNSTLAPLHIGKSTYVTDRYLRGTLDEIRLSNPARSPGWILTCYNDEKDPSAFYAVGAEEALPSEPIVSDPNPINGATNVPTALTELSFDLTDYQELMDYSVSTYPDVGSNSQTGVGSARYSVAISGLQYSTTYTWKLNVTDGTHWTNKTYTFTTAPAPADWWNTSWQYRRTITIDHTKVSSDQTDFPVLIDLTDNGLTTKVQANGNDFVFTDANQTKLSHEKESYNSGTGHLIVWIKVPVLSSTTDTVLYMYYGNPTCGDQQTRNAVWDLSNRMILHLAETSGTQYDSTVNGNNATPNDGVIQGTAGKIDGSDTFDGTNDYLQTPHSDTLTVFSQGFTASFWLRLDDVSRRQTIINKYNSATGQRSWYIEYQTNLLGFFASQDGTIYREWHATFRPVAGTWYFIAITWEPNAVPKFYVNGTQVTTSGAAKIASIYNNAGVPLYIGICPYDGTRYLRGGLDEIRISNPSRNVGWILSSYNNQKDPTTFYQLGTEEERAPNVAPFSLVVLPDTQVYSQSYPFILDNQTRWIVDNDVNMNMLFVLHEGDIVNSDVVAQWANANSSMSRLDGHVPWAVLPGNHDGTNVGTPSENLANYNTYFPYSRFGGETWYGDAYNSINTNSYVLFSGGEDEYIVFNFQYHPSDAVLAWASTTIATYPNRRAIVVTHDYLNNTDGTRTTEGNHIWNNFVSIHADQIFLVLCGHMHGEARRQDTVNGHVVYQVLADYQTRDHGGNGWLRILEFHPAEDTIHVKTFSPYLNIWETDADSQFILDCEMVDYDDIVFDSSFETGNLKNVQFQSGDALGNRLYTGEQDHTTVSGMTDKHWWFYFSMDEVADKTVTIRLLNNEVADMSTRWAGMEPVYSFDNINWERLQLSAFAVDIPARTFQMTVTLPSEQNKIWLAPLPPYTIGLRDALFEEFKSSPYLDVASLGTTPGGQELKVATITDDAYSDSNKIKAYVIAMQHSTEVPGGWEADGMIRFLLSDDPTAQAVRRSYIFRIVPIVNVDGVFYGRSRYTPLREGEQYDLNRWWDDPVANMPFEIAQIFTDIQSFQPQSFNDIHSTIGIEMGSPEDAVTYTWSGGTSDATVVAFLNKIRDAGWPDTQRGTTYYACSQVHSKLGVARSISWENPQDEFITSPGHKLTISDWREMGKAYAKGVYLDGGGVSYFVPLEFAENVERWKDVADQEYGSSFQETYDYSQATVSIQYSVLDETLTGTLTAQNLKPNFVYQLKLAGTPGTIDNEFLGFAGRWWQEEWNGTAWVNGQNLNNKGSGTSPNPNDNDYSARKSITDGSSPTGYHYRYTGYLLFGYFITDSNGDANLYFETGNCYHVLWKTTQRAHVADDGPLKTVTFDPVLSAAYDTDYPSSTVSIFGEWERLPMGSVNLAAGNYSCQVVLTEESFHGTGPLEGNWAAAMNTNIFFSIIS